MENNNKIDHVMTRNVVCPYCGYEDSGSWELKGEETECQSCGKKYGFERMFYYNTWKIKE